MAAPTGTMKALALDFDGVVSDSARESFAVALAAWVEERPDSSLIALAAGGDPSRSADASVYEAFVEAMPLGNRAEDYAVVLRALETGRALPDQAAYDALRQECDPADLARFHHRFYALRHAWQDRDPEGWRALLAPYPGLLEVLRRRAGTADGPRAARLAIATAKDRRSVARLLHDYGAADLFAPELVLDKETGVSKRAHLETLARRLGLALPAITFVDDKVNHLEDVEPLGVRCVLAAWGYNGSREQRRAEARGYLVCGLDDFEERVFGPAS